ncbi:hypothetical protein ANANG_G00210090 [Anguilla anguilla]|uniref:DCDC1 second doublecortin-like domain-containing protein n=1 Tax=Anguilla anguilla TaxID=7936 RepID=A0A9D3RRW6_ANGAN|nr:hypothetical protein ANANG_G00210090 [Anguilla anguilla]
MNERYPVIKRAHLSLSKEASWTVNGVVLPASPGRGRTRPALSRRLRGLSRAAPALRVLAFRNGAGSEGCEVAAAGPVEQFLDLCTLKLQLTSTAQLLYDWEGNRVQDIGLVPLLDGCLQGSATPLRGPVWVSRGEWFSPAGAKVYIQGALRALRGKLRPAAEYLAQVSRRGLARPLPRPWGSGSPAGCRRRSLISGPRIMTLIVSVSR